MQIIYVTKENIMPFLPLCPGGKLPRCAEDEVSESLESWLLLGAIDETDHPIGILCAEMQVDALVLRHIYVVPERRRQGVGRELIRYMHFNATQCLFDVSSCSYLSSEYPELDRFFSKNGFTEVAEESHVFRVQLKDLTTLSELAKKADDFAGIPLKEVAGIHWNSFVQQISALQASDPEGKYPTLQKRSYYDEEFSFFAIKENTPSAAVLMSRHEEEILIDFLCITEGSSAQLLPLLLNAYQAVHRLVSPDTYLVANALAPNVEGLLSKLSAGKAQIIDSVTTRYCLY